MTNKPLDTVKLTGYLQKALYKFVVDQPFYGSMLQSMPVRFNLRIPTAALTYDKETQSYQVIINPYFFEQLSAKNRVAVFHHEILHFVYQHLTRFSKFFEKAEAEHKNKKKGNGKATSMADVQLVNVACDMAINQYILNLPEGCIDYKKFKDDKGQPFPAQQTAETYYNLLKDNPSSQEQLKKMQSEGEGKQVDEHDWVDFDSLSEEEQKQYLEATEKIVERSMEKSGFGWGQLPGELTELLKKLKENISSLNYKKILADAIKRSASGVDRKATWTRPNKRYGNLSPGTKVGDLPSLCFYFDMSGSVSIKEYNEFLEVIDGFINVGERKCKIFFFDTRIFKERKYKKGDRLENADITGGGGGTCLQDTMSHIRKTSPDISIVLTDGYYGDVNVKTGSNQIFFIISKNGTDEHPLKRFGRTIKLSSLV